MSQLLIDSMPLTFTLEESADKPGKYVARGEFARSDRPTENRRLYKQPLWEREIGRLSEAMKSRRVLGELDHPADGRTKLVRVSHLLTNLRIENNQIIGEAEIMDTPNGRILKAILDAGAQVGVSSRGFGTTKTIAGGVEEVQEDFKLHTFDFVADPATKTAYPQIFREEIEKIPEDGMELTLEDLKRDYPGLVEALTDEIKGGRVDSKTLNEAVTDAEERTERRLQEKFSAELRRSMEKVEEAAYEKAVSELSSDPKVAGAVMAVENIAGIIAPFVGPSEIQSQMDEKDKEIEGLKNKLAERELEAQSAQGELKKMTEVAKQATYQLHLERILSDDESKDAIISLIGDVTQFENIEAMESKVETVREDLTKAKQEEKEQEEKKNEEHEARMRELEARIEEAEKRAQEAEEAKEKADERTRNALDIAEELQEKIQGYEGREEPRTLDEDQAERIRRRVAKGKERSIEEDTGDGNRTSDGGNGVNPLEEFGLTEETFNEFAGTKKSLGN